MRWMTVLHMSTRVKRTGFQKPVFHFKRTWIVLCHLMRVGHVSFSPQIVTTWVEDSSTLIRAEEIETRRRN